VFNALACLEADIHVHVGQIMQNNGTLNLKVIRQGHLFLSSWSKFPDP